MGALSRRRIQRQNSRQKRCDANRRGLRFGRRSRARGPLAMLCGRWRFLACLCCLWPALVYADPSAPRDLIAAGNAAYAAEEYAAALDAYAQVGEVDDPALSAALLHNRAAASFRQGDLEGARDLWTRATSLGDAAWEAQMRYNLGNVGLAQAKQLAAGQPPQLQAALKSVERAIAQYRDAVRLDRSLADARANLELACALRRQLRDQQQQNQQQNQQQGDQQQDGREQSDSDQEQSDPNAPPPPPDPNNPPPQSRDPNQTQPQRDPNETQRDPNQAQSPEPDPNQPPPDPNETPAPPDPNEMQPQSADADPNAGGDPNMQTRPLSPLEIQRLLELIRQRDQQRREILRERARRAAKQRSVEKDW